MATLDDLLDYVFEGKRSVLYPEFEGWVRDSRRFRAFATSYRDKIRAKLRNARDVAGVEDLRAELEAAALLLNEERFTLEYETYAASKQRGPDLTVTFKTHTRFNVEIRRVRSVEVGGENDGARTGKLTGVICDKVRQMPPSIVNLLWLVADRGLTEADLVHTATTLRQLAERKAEGYFTRRGYEGSTDFLRQYHRLSGIVLRQSGENVVWLNSLARHRAPPDIVTAIRRLGSSSYVVRPHPEADGAERRSR